MTIKTIAALALGACPAAVFAHPGHGLDWPHLHGAEIWSFIAVGIVATVALWLARENE